MQLTFDIADELDLTNEIPSTLNAISALVLALPYFKKYAGINDDTVMSASYFLAGAIDDVAQAVRDYADKKIAEQRKEIKK
ncbi:hypothetical protein [uncultured Campylobacter sp.]|uniref:hypothetical protein n=1 Tax=uncultured Campylobacter sp. TaxID=218934 RepID=UPI0025F51496|nr:hypothetical protein [uncultured Campylobacter sp.]